MFGSAQGSALHKARLLRVVLVGEQKIFYSNLKISDFLLGVLKVVGAQISKSNHINVQSISLT